MNKLDGSVRLNEVVRCPSSNVDSILSATQDVQ